LPLNPNSPIPAEPGHYNFALARVRLQSATGAVGVRASFRLFRWGVANVEFDSSLAYRSAPTGIARLGRTSTNELASIPFFAAARVATTDSMDTQMDPKNVDNFGPTGSAGASSYFGAYLDINQTTPRFPAAFVGDGPFSSGLQSIRTLLVGNHQCMVVELVYAPDPTDNGATPGTSDNLAQRNLLIVQTANPGDEITRTVQHAFDIDLTRKRPRRDKQTHAAAMVHLHGDHDGDSHHDHDHADDHGGNSDHLNPEENCCMPALVQRPVPKAGGAVHAHSISHLESGWVAQFPELLKRDLQHAHHVAEAAAAWEIDPDTWKSGTGLDELVFFWNGLPEGSMADLYLPGLSVTDCFNFRSLRHAPDTVRFVDNHTLRMIPRGITYLPIPPFWGDNLAGLITVRLPAGIKKGQRYKVDVLQLRGDEARTLGGFQLQIQVEKAHGLHESERRWLELFHQRLALLSPGDRFRPILEKQVAFTRERAKAFVDLANLEGNLTPPLSWTDPTVDQRGQKIRVTLEKIQVTDDEEPFFKGKGEFQFYSQVSSNDNGGQTSKRKFPLKKYHHLGASPGTNEVILGEVMFEGYVENDLFVHIGGVELDTFDADDVLNTYKRAFGGKPADWIRHYGPDTTPAVEDVGGWKVWYRIEYAG
jgi:hypothetical protein